MKTTVQEFLGEAARKSFGAISTPEEVVSLMLDLSGMRSLRNADILEPAAGFCYFLAAAKAVSSRNRFTGVELHDEVISAAKKMHPSLTLISHDYVTWDTQQRYDLIIGNPPYGIIGSGTHYAIDSVKEQKAEYKQRTSTWSGKYNIYGAFVEKSVNLLKPSGTLCFVIPATWFILRDFKLLRKFLSENGSTSVYYLGKNAFKGVSVTVAILVFKKGERGLSVFERLGNEFVLQNEKQDWSGGLIRFHSPLMEKFESGELTIDDLFSIRISARSPEVKKHPLVRTFGGGGYLPLLNGRNVHVGHITRDPYSGYWMPGDKVATLKRYYAITRVVIGHTKGGKIISAIEDSGYPYIGGVFHLVPKKKTSKARLATFTEYLNAPDTQRYMSEVYKDISPHFTLDQLRMLRFPARL